MKQTRGLKGPVVEVLQGQFGVAKRSEGYQFLRTTHTTTCTIVVLLERDREVAMLLHIDTIFRAITIDRALDAFVKSCDDLAQPFVECEMKGGIKHQGLKFLLPSYWVRLITARALEKRLGVARDDIKESYTQRFFEPKSGSGFEFDLETKESESCNGKPLSRKGLGVNGWFSMAPALISMGIPAPILFPGVFSLGLSLLALVACLFFLNFGWPGSSLEQAEV